MEKNIYIIGSISFHGYGLNDYHAGIVLECDEDPNKFIGKVVDIIQD